MPKGVIPRRYISPHIRDVNQTTDASDHCFCSQIGIRGVGRQKLAKNLRGVGTRVPGSICLRDTVARKSTTADVEVVL